MIAALFRRYSQKNVRFVGRAQPLYLRDGELVGYIESIEISGGNAKISGWSLLDGLTVSTAAKHKRVMRRLHRGDVVIALGLLKLTETGNADGRVGFAAEIEWQQGGLSLCSAQGGIFIIGHSPHLQIANIPRLLERRCFHS